MYDIKERYKSKSTGTANDAILLAVLLTFLFSRAYHFRMERYMSQQRVEIIKNYYRKWELADSTLKAPHPIYGRNNRPSRSLINWPSSGKIWIHKVRRRSARSVENITAAEASVEESPKVSLTRLSVALIFSVTLLWGILRNDLGLHPYKIKWTQELKPLDHQKHRMFVNWAEQQLKNYSDFYRKIFFSDRIFKSI